jgi:hypothetical protein
MRLVRRHTEPTGTIALGFSAVFKYRFRLQAGGNPASLSSRPAALSLTARLLHRNLRQYSEGGAVRFRADRGRPCSAKSTRKVGTIEEAPRQHHTATGTKGIW